MLVTSVKISTIRTAVLLLALGVIVAVVLWPRSQLAVEADSRGVTGISTNEQRVQYIQGFGWTVDAQPIEVVEVNIPRAFNAVYNNYNELQKKQGFNLLPYRGRRVKRWTYRITNYPGVTDEVRCNLLIYDDRVIGGDVSTVAISGFMHGLSRANIPQTTTSPQKADITAEIFTRVLAQ